MDILKIKQDVYNEIIRNLSTRSAECGGVLGAGDDGVVSEFYFDATGKSMPYGYAPDVTAINDMLVNDWMPRSILMVGIVHSHANGNTVPSCGDVGYGIRILQAMDTVDSFYLPIVTTHNGQMRMDCYMICRDEQYGFACRKVDYVIVDKTMTA